MPSRNIWENTEITETGQLAYLSIACTTRCNLDCLYCSKKGSEFLDLNPQLLYRTLEEAIELGLRKVEFTGGEPLLYPYLMDLIRFLVKKEVTVLMVSNGTLLNPDTAQKLADWGVNIGISLSTLKEDQFDHLSQTKGLFDSVLNSLEYLKKAGYGGERVPLVSIQSIASRDTFSELEALREFTRQQGAMFIVNRAIPVGGLQAENVPTGIELKTFLDEEFEGRGQASIPFSSDSPCNRLKAGCYIGSDANIKPCPAIDLTLGNLNRHSLRDIWQNSPVLHLCRNIDQQLEGSCAQCPESHRCYGCRAVAYAVWGSLTGPDPCCFRFTPDRKFNVQYDNNFNNSDTPK